MDARWMLSDGLFFTLENKKVSEICDHGFEECHAWKEFEGELETAITLFIVFMISCGIVAFLSILFLIVACQTMQRYKTWTIKGQTRMSQIILSASVLLVFVSGVGIGCAWMAVYEYNGDICKDLAKDSKFEDETGAHLPFMASVCVHPIPSFFFPPLILMMLMILMTLLIRSSDPSYSFVFWSNREMMRPSIRTFISKTRKECSKNGFINIDCCNSLDGWRKYNGIRKTIVDDSEEMLLEDPIQSDD
jgi:hypothetical protein